MKLRNIVLTAVVGLVAMAMAYASDNANMGTWKLNEAKSKIAAGMPKNTTVVYEMAGDNIKVTVDGVEASGKPAHNEWTGKFDGKDYPLTGDPVADMRSYKKVDAHTTELTNKKDGKVTATAKIVIAPDGKSRTVTVSATGPDGKKVSSKSVYDKQ